MTGNTPQGTGQIDRAGLINMEEREIQNRKMETMRGHGKKDEWSDKQKMECWNVNTRPHTIIFTKETIRRGTCTFISELMYALCDM